MSRVIHTHTWNSGLWGGKLGWEEGLTFLADFGFSFYPVYVDSTFIIKGILKIPFLPNEKYFCRLARSFQQTKFLHQQSGCSEYF